MFPFGETVLAWRLARGMTQAELAVAARLPRPNLSAIERGDREVTLKTLRSLAFALGIRPGVLADGVSPHDEGRGLSRAGLERVAHAAVGDRPLRDPREAAAARWLRKTASARIGDADMGPRPFEQARGSDRAYFRLRVSETAETVASLVDRLAGASGQVTRRR